MSGDCWTSDYADGPAVYEWLRRRGLTECELTSTGASSRIEKSIRLWGMGEIANVWMIDRVLTWFTDCHISDLPDEVWLGEDFEPPRLRDWQSQIDELQEQGYSIREAFAILLDRGFHGTFEQVRYGYKKAEEAVAA